MKLFHVGGEVHFISRFSQFAEEFVLSEGDLLLTESVLFEKVLKPLHLPCQIILKDDYSSGEPTEEVVDAILRDMMGRSISRVIAVGGGSVIDIGKVICVKDAYPISRVMTHQVPAIYDKTFIAVPTTCGTGSEVTYGSVITMKDTGLKTAIMDKTLTAHFAVLIPELLEGLPFSVFVNCSVDALGHAMESYVSATRGNELARAVGARAIRLLTNGYRILAVEGETAKKKLLPQFIQASCLAGMAVNNGGAGPVHALAYPLGEIYHMSHGESIYQFLPEVFCHYERMKGGALLEELSDLLKVAETGAGICEDSAFVGLRILLEKISPRRSLSACGMKESDIQPFTKSIFQTKERLLAASYAEFTPEDAAAIYRQRM